MSRPAADERRLRRERWYLLRQVERALETPLVVLGFVWLALLVVEFVWGLGAVLERVVLVIWGLFVVNFAVEFTLAPSKRVYLRRNWLTALSLVVPAIRVFRVLRVLRAFRGLRLVKVVGSLNRGMRALRMTMRRRGFSYVASLTALVTFAGAAGMHAFERHVPAAEGGLTTYTEALWWTSMVMTTMGSSYWPVSPEGRVLCVLLALYAFGVFGYVTATLATFFVGRDAEDGRAEVAGAKAVEELSREVAALREEIRALLAARGGAG